jgi:hypothetical protein
MQQLIKLKICFDMLKCNHADVQKFIHRREVKQTAKVFTAIRQETQHTSLEVKGELMAEII